MEQTMSLDTWKASMREYDPEVRLLWNSQEARRVSRDLQRQFDKALDIDPESRHATFIISTSDVDRMNDRVNVDGWSLDGYTGVVLFNHDYYSLPMGNDKGTTRVVTLEQTTDNKALLIEEDTGTMTSETGNRKRALVSTCFFPDAGIHPFGDTVHDMVVGGWLCSSSVGFNPEEWSFDEERGGFNFIRQVLLEWSIVSVPALSQAVLLEAKSAGVNVQPLVEAVELQLDSLHGESGYWIPRKELQDLVLHFRPNRRTIFDQLETGYKGRDKMVSELRNLVQESHEAQRVVPLPIPGARDSALFTKSSTSIKPPAGETDMTPEIKGIADALNAQATAFDRLSGLLKNLVPAGAQDLDQPMTVGQAQQLVQAAIDKAMGQMQQRTQPQPQQRQTQDDDDIVTKPDGTQVRVWKLELPLDTDYREFTAKSIRDQIAAMTGQLQS